MKDFGWESGLRIAFYYTLTFSVVMAAIFLIAHFALARTMHKAEYEFVRNQALEYRAWFLAGDIDKLEARMGEQLVREGDIYFVHISGPGFDYINFNTQEARFPSREKFLQLDPRLEGVSVPVNGYQWAMSSVPIGNTGLVLQAGRHSRSFQDTLAQFRRAFLIAFIPGILIAAIIGTAITYISLAPIRRLVQTMNSILASGELGHRASEQRGKSELNALVGLFNRLLGRNERLVKNMRESLDHVAHDLRTPISRLHMTAERALDPGSDSHQIREALADCVEESEYLEQLLTVLMNVTEAKAGAMKLEQTTFELKPLLHDIAELYEFVAEDKNIELKVDCSEELTLNADRTRLAQVLANLVDNATKYSDENTTIELSGRSESDQVVLTITDQGRGIPEEDLPHIWKRLYRADPSRTTPGMGIGLSLVKAVVELHGGTVEVESTKGKGSRFQLTFPRGGASQAPSQ
ncbi:ATP-binding protein [Akkermansiaceae bacterium]|nr:ATP-binding protein [Akkermansiaceae bacterium]MDA7888358.1 ATP-binding protein [Akkermansiaceae bacterium]